jgi:hypothetical protein
MISDWTFSKHALSRAVDMAVDPHELTACIIKPEVIYDQETNPAYFGHKVRVAGRLALVVDPNDKHVVTVLWRSEEGRNLELVRDRRKCA